MFLHAIDEKARCIFAECRPNYIVLSDHVWSYEAKQIEMAFILAIKSRNSGTFGRIGHLY